MNTLIQMMIFENLTNENIRLYSVKAYENPTMLLSDYNEDVKRFNYIKKLFNRYHKTGIISERLILNHITVIYNVFNRESATRMLFFMLPYHHHSVLKTFLTFFQLMPDIVFGIRDNDIHSKNISIDERIMDILKKI